LTDTNQKQLGKNLWGIAAQTQKLEAIKTHKKGLMQQLFPSPEEVEA